ncbi:MAG: tRNA (cmo5U34)-methyltransferase [Gammaproteobacteria bacterium SG8_47]|nr:MAG: tRNA (cmo5U34)-methyltransferase [Gammaproteobacteria bacterium SG8_47]
MNHNEDTLYAAPREKIVDFVFDEQVAQVFPDMIRRSVPGYEAIISLLGLFAEHYAQPGTRVYDLGCSLGASTLSVRRRLRQPGCRIVAVDSSPAMTERCRANIEADPGPAPVDVVCADVRDVAIENASLVILNFTLQFLPPEQRLDMLSRIAHGLRPGGVLVLSEKLAFPKPGQQTWHEAMHEGFKRANGYSDLEISQKRSALEQVLVPDTLGTHCARLAMAGFAQTQVWFQCFNFFSLAATK